MSGLGSEYSDTALLCPGSCLIPTDQIINYPGYTVRFVCLLVIQCVYVSGFLFFLIFLFLFSVFFTVMFCFYFKCGLTSKSWDRILESDQGPGTNLCATGERGLHFTSRTEIKCSCHPLFSCNCILHA